MSETQIANTRDFKRQAESISREILTAWVGEDRAKEAIGRVSAALMAACASAKNPRDFYDSTPQSVAQVVAVSALTGIMVGTGAAALAYAVPRRARKGEPPQLQYMLSHRGLCALARRAGMHVVATPVHVSAALEVDGSEVVSCRQDPDLAVLDWQDLRGIAVRIRDLSTGQTVMHGWVPRALIERRRETSDSYKYAERNDWARSSSPWHAWPAEMAAKTAIHYAISRGWAVIDDTATMRALAVDASADVIDVTATTAEAPRRVALPDLGGADAPPDFASETERLAEREAIPREPSEESA